MCREFQLGYHSMVHIVMLVGFLGQRMRPRSLSIQNGDKVSVVPTKYLVKYGLLQHLWAFSYQLQHHQYNIVEL